MASEVGRTKRTPFLQATTFKHEHEHEHERRTPNAEREAPGENGLCLTHSPPRLPIEPGGDVLQDLLKRARIRGLGNRSSMRRGQYVW